MIEWKVKNEMPIGSSRPGAESGATPALASSTLAFSTRKPLT